AILCNSNIIAELLIKKIDPPDMLKDILKEEECKRIIDLAIRKKMPSIVQHIQNIFPELKKPNKIQESESPIQLMDAALVSKNHEDQKKKNSEALEREKKEAMALYERRYNRLKEAYKTFQRNLQDVSTEKQELLNNEYKEYISTTTDALTAQIERINFFANRMQRLHDAQNEQEKALRQNASKQSIESIFVKESNSSIWPDDSESSSDDEEIETEIETKEEAEEIEIEVKEGQKEGQEEKAEQKQEPVAAAKQKKNKQGEEREEKEEKTGKKLPYRDSGRKNPNHKNRDKDSHRKRTQKHPPLTLERPHPQNSRRMLFNKIRPVSVAKDQKIIDQKAAAIALANKREIRADNVKYTLEIWNSLIKKWELPIKEIKDIQNPQVLISALMEKKFSANDQLAIQYMLESLLIELTLNVPLGNWDPYQRKQMREAILYHKAFHPAFQGGEKEYKKWEEYAAELLIGLIEYQGFIHQETGRLTEGTHSPRSVLLSRITQPYISQKNIPIFIQSEQGRSKLFDPSNKERERKEHEKNSQILNDILQKSVIRQSPLLDKREKEFAESGLWMRFLSERHKAHKHQKDLDSMVESSLRTRCNHWRHPGTIPRRKLTTLAMNDEHFQKLFTSKKEEAQEQEEAEQLIMLKRKSKQS